MQDEAVSKAKNETTHRRASVSGVLPVDILILGKWQKQMRSERYLRPLSVEAYGTDARQFAEFMAGRGRDLSSAGVEDVEVFISHLRETDIADRSIARKLSALVRFYDWMVKKKLIDYNPTVFSQVPKTWSNQPLPLTEAAVKKMLDEARSPAEHLHLQQIEVRDSAILELLYDGGIRVSELTGLDIENLELDAGAIYVRGKGDKERRVRIADAAKTALEKYLSSRRLDFPQPSGISNSAVFLSNRGNRLTRQWIWGVVKNANPTAYPHRMRHSCASHMVAHGAPLKNAQQKLGHKFISTTDCYTQPPSTEQLEKTFQQSHSRAHFKTNSNQQGPEAAKGGKDE